MYLSPERSNQRSAQPYGVAASLGLGAVADDHEVDETYAREALDIMAADAGQYRFVWGEVDETILDDKPTSTSADEVPRLDADRRRS